MTDPDFFFADDDVTTGPDFYPDGLTPEAITALQRDVDRELGHEGYPVRDGQRPTPRRSTRGPVEPTTRPVSAAITPAPGSCVSPLPGAPGQRGGTGAAEGAVRSTGEPAGDPVPTLFTPTQAAELLHVPESWLRRRAARRLVPCTFLGKHLRFSRANLNQIITDAARPAATARRSVSDTGAAPRRRGRPPVRTRTDSRRPTR
jgi:excisionase family DNA binding protein